MPHSVLVIDDQPLEGEMISLVLSNNRPDIHYIGQALNASAGIRMAAEHHPDLVFLDIRMPGIDGLSAIPQLKQACPTLQIVILSAFDDFEYLRGALRGGARDYLLKPVRPSDILSALDILDLSADPQFSAAAAISLPKADLLIEAVQSGDSHCAEQAALDWLETFSPFEQSNPIIACVRCMELGAKMTQADAEHHNADSLSFLYQDLVHQVSALKDIDQLHICFVDFVKKAADIYSHAAGDVGFRQIAEVKQYISEHLHEPLQLSEVAGKLYLSTAYFSRLFKEKTGLTFSDYLANCRIEKARHLLATTDLSISEVASAIGYQEANSFSRVFKARTGQSPTLYRTTQQNHA